MHPTPTFKYDDRAEALAFVAEHPFATLAVNGELGPVTALVPLVFDEEGETLLGHVARANPFWKAAQTAGTIAAAVFRGANAYISPSAYASKKIHGKAVPTWNYLAVEVRGRILIETQPNALMPYIVALTEKMESHRTLPWQVSDAPEDYIAKLSRAIIGFSLDIEDITYVRKLSQNKSAEDKQGVIDTLEKSDQSEDNLMARLMKEEG